ncbi:hypothetical protein Maes01_00803 [Microbulbifer aestuariivivens]|uniref:DUF3014 domain-containing protein n=1 Tax=Microbulbifer aestuariivivens TaxID=1908308 RepID=A0ABP9WMA7_9GAMM
MSEQQSSRGWILGLIIVAAIAAGAYFFLRGSPAPAPAPPPAAEPQPEPAPEVTLEPEPEPQTAAPAPAPAPEPQRPLPPLNQSDAAARADLLSLAPDGALGRWIVPDEVVRKWVAAVTAAAGGEMMAKNRPYNSPPEELIIKEAGATGMQLSEENYQRYDAPVRLFAMADTDTAIQLYRFWYPRLSQAFGELGMGDKTFQQVFLKAIDVALAAPQAEQPIQLVRPSVYYKFADPQLEKLPGVHKLMIRIGPENAARVKEKLRALKAALEAMPKQNP